MPLYLISIIVFLFTNYFLSSVIKKYTYEKFFIYVIIYFVVINLLNISYIKSSNFFVFQTIFCVAILFLYSALYRSVSIRVLVLLFLKKKSVNVNDFYKNNFIKKSFNKRIKILVDNNFIIKKKKYYMLTLKGEKYLNFFKIIKSFYKIKFNG